MIKIMKAPAVTVEAIAAAFSQEINAHLQMHLEEQEKAYNVDFSQEDALIVRRTHLDLARYGFEAAMTIWQLAKVAEIVDMLDIDPKLIGIIRQTIKTKAA